MDEIFFFLILFSVGIGYFAHTKGRNPVGWAVLSFFISPLITGIILAVSKDLNAEMKIEQIENKTDNLKMEMNYNQKFNDYRAEHMSSQIKSLDSPFQSQNKLNPASNNLQLDRKVKCNSCGEMVNYNSKFCYKCGIEIEKEKNCRTCNQKYPVDSNFCPQCGTKADINQTCSNCGERYEMETKYCTSCGVSIMQTNDKY
jgi:RNA polymerase subunit RPABC4/transcription elongation factor Spt4